METINSESIVVATDGSPDADRAVRWASEQANLERRRLVVLTVVEEVMPGPAGGIGPGYFATPDQLHDCARGIAELGVALATQHRPGIRAEKRAVLGIPRATIVDLTTDSHLLVLGSRGRGSVRSKLLGSVSAWVAKHAACPVIVCRPSDEPAARGIIVGVDGTAQAKPVIDFAFRQASLRSRPLTVLLCLHDVLAAVDGPSLVPDTEPDHEDDRLELAESVAGFRERYPEVDVTLHLARGYASDCLAASSHGHELVVVGRHPVDSLGRRLGGVVSTAVIEHSRSAVAVVPEAAADRTSVC